MPYKDPKSEHARAMFKKHAARYYARHKDKRNTAQRQWVINNKDRTNAYLRERNAANPKMRMLRGAKQRAARKGIEFRLTELDIVIPETCPVLGIPLARYCGNKAGGAPTLDRKDNSLGYIPGNVAVISHRANRLKGDATLDEMLAIVRYMKSGV